VIAVCAVWSADVAVTAVGVSRTRDALALVAANLAHHNAAHGGDRVVDSLNYLAAIVRKQAPGPVSSVEIRRLREGELELVEVRISAEVGVAVLGHPRIRVTVVRSEPVEDVSRLP